MTNGTAAATILSDTILGRENPWADFFDAKRLKPLASAPMFVKGTQESSSTSSAIA